jgi:hypothetical protein
MTTLIGIEPMRAEPIGFQVQLLNHSDTMSILVKGLIRRRQDSNLRSQGK